MASSLVYGGGSLSPCLRQRLSFRSEEQIQTPLSSIAAQSLYWSSKWKRKEWFNSGTALDLAVIVPRGCLILAKAGGSRTFFGSRRPRTTSRQDVPGSDGPPVNDRISAPVVRLLGEDGKVFGILPTEEALNRAREADLDLLQLDNQDPPCVKIIDYSKYKYELQKKKREQQKKNAGNRMDLKELKMRYNIDTHDYDVRIRSAQRFLNDGHKVRFTIQFKGRELEFKELGRKLFERFQEDLGEACMLEGKVTIEGKQISMILVPNKNKLQGSTPATDKAKQNLQEKESLEVSAAAVDVQ
eukprot:c23688_g1_i1 orf=173-1069(+)